MAIKHSSARNKGRSGEQEVMLALTIILVECYKARGLPPPELSRGPQGRDVRGISWLAPEVKRHEPTTGYSEVTQQQIKGWWEQAKSQAGKHQIPVLFYRANHQPWRVRMFGYLDLTPGRIECPVDIPMETFKVWFKEKVIASLTVKSESPG